MARNITHGNPKLETDPHVGPRPANAKSLTSRKVITMSTTNDSRSDRKPAAFKLEGIDHATAANVDGGLSVSSISAVSLNQLAYHYQGCFPVNFQIQPVSR